MAKKTISDEDELSDTQVQSCEEFSTFLWGKLRVLKAPSKYCEFIWLSQIAKYINYFIHNITHA
jgi:hypothetical protein